MAATLTGDRTILVVEVRAFGEHRARSIVAQLVMRGVAAKRPRFRGVRVPSRGRAAERSSNVQRAE